MSTLLQEIGLTQQEIQDRIIDRLVSEICETRGCDEDGNETGPFTSTFKKKLDEQVTAKINDSIANLFNAKVAPGIEHMVSELTLQETNRWGESVGKKISFIEYLVQRADAYIREEVDHNGKSRAEANDSYWRKNTTRVSYMIDKYLQYSIETAMKQALETANASLAKGINDAVCMKLNELVAKIDCSVKVKS